MAFLPYSTQVQWRGARNNDGRFLDEIGHFVEFQICDAVVALGGIPTLVSLDIYWLGFC